MSMTNEFTVLKDLVSAVTKMAKDGQVVHDSILPLLPISEMDQCKSQTASKITEMSRKLVEIRRTLKAPLRFISFLVVLGSLGVIWNGFVKTLGDLFSLRLLDIIVKCYQIFFALLVLTLEVSRYTNLFKMKKTIHFWMPFLEFTVGRGFIQLLAAGLAIGESVFTSGGFFSLALAIIGFFNVIYGLAYVIQFNLISKKIQLDLLGLNKNSQRAFDMIQNKFQSMDISGDGRLTKEEFVGGCHELNLMLSDYEIDTIFRMFDGDKKGFIELDRFEAWWYMNLNKIP